MVWSLPGYLQCKPFVSPHVSYWILDSLSGKLGFRIPIVLVNFPDSRIRIPIVNGTLGKTLACVAGVKKGRGRRNLGAREPPYSLPSSLLPRARSRALVHFPFPFERLPRRLGGHKSFYKWIDTFWFRVHLDLLLHSLTQLYKHTTSWISLTKTRCCFFYPDWTLKAVNLTHFKISLTSVKIRFVRARTNLFFSRLLRG